MLPIHGDCEKIYNHPPSIGFRMQPLLFSLRYPLQSFLNSLPLSISLSLSLSLFLSLFYSTCLSLTYFHLFKAYASVLAMCLSRCFILTESHEIFFLKRLTHVTCCSCNSQTPLKFQSMESSCMEWCTFSLVI